MPRLVLHAGFQKTGSSTVQSFIRRNFAELFRSDVLHLGEDLDVARKAHFNGFPLWSISRATEFDESAKQLRKSMENSIQILKEGQIGLLSSEMLSSPKSIPLFKGVDEIIDTEIVFYMRPQFSWIPSAWKQWGMKRGVTLEQFVKASIDNNRPDYRGVLDQWASSLPKANICLKIMDKELLYQGDLAKDFANFLGLDVSKFEFVKDRTNPSPDYSLLEVLSRHAGKFYSGPHDNAINERILSKVDVKYRNSNTNMLSLPRMTEIESFFKVDNNYILRKYISGIDPEYAYERYFVPQVDGDSFMEFSPRDKLGRVIQVLADTIGEDKCFSYIADILEKEFGE